MTDWGVSLALVLGLSLWISGVIRLLAAPAVIWFEVSAWLKRRRGEPMAEGRLSVIVPCYNEARVLENCVNSLVQVLPEGGEVVLVDDGSKDETWEIAQRLAAQHESVKAIHKENGGKGSALNTGIQACSGELLMLTDADGVFTRESINEMLRGLADPRIGAVCGDDRPVNLNTVQTRFLTLISHVGTGFMRRALSVLRILPIVSGNIGAFRRSVVEEVGLLRTDTLGEDLELTWRIHEAGYRVVMRPRALVYAESPSTLTALWRQRVRWARGLFQTARHHWFAIGNPRYGLFGISLAFLVVGSVILPLAQLLSLPLALWLAISGVPDALPGGFIEFLFWISIPISLVLVIISCLIDRAPGDLRHLWTFPLWPLFSIWASCVAVRGLWLELRGAERSWNKLERVGVVSVGEAQLASESSAQRSLESEGAEPIIAPSPRRAAAEPSVTQQDVDEPTGTPRRGNGDSGPRRMLED